MPDEFISLEAAARRSGLHVNTLRRLLRYGVIQGHKTFRKGKYHWSVSVKSLDEYTSPTHGFLLELPGPKLFLRRRDERDDPEPE